MQNNLLSAPSYLNYLSDNEKKALSELKGRILEKYPEAKLILYGSKARGNYNKDSDIDLLIVINDDYQIDKDISFKELSNQNFMRVSKSIRAKILDDIVDIELKYDIDIDWQVEYKSYLNTRVAEIESWYQNIKREGIDLCP